MPFRPDPPRDLLFGALALRLGLVDPLALAEAARAWSRAGGRPIGEILVEAGDLDPAGRDRVDGLVAGHLGRPGDDPGSGLAALASRESTVEYLARIGDLEAGPTRAGSGTPTAGDDRPVPPPDPAPRPAGGPRFRVLRPHARGGLGAVFVALDGELNREVALKRILDDRADDEASRSRFLVEAEVTGKLEHPGIVPVYGLGHDPAGRPYYAMRLVRGGTLQEAIAGFHADPGPDPDPGRRSLALRRLLRRLVDVCNAVEYAHSRGIVHRDLKPANIVLGMHGETLVVDWGLAKPFGPDSAPGKGREASGLAPPPSSGSASTLPGSALGTPGYMSPEQAAGDLDRVGPRSDVYGLGATLYCLLCGRPPFAGPDLDALLRAVRAGAFPAPGSVKPGVDPALESICLRAMATDPRGRYESPRALADDIDRWAADEPVSAHREPASGRARRWARRHRTAVVAASAAGLVALAGLAGVLAVEYRAVRDLGLKNADLDRAHRREVRANAELKAAGERAQGRFDLARESIRTFRAAVEEEEVLADERFRPLRNRLLRSAADFHDRLGRLLEGQADARARLAQAAAYRELGGLVDAIGDHAEALAAYRKELAARRSLALGDDPQALLALADCLNYTGLAAYNLGEPDEADRHWSEAGRLLSTEPWPPGLADPAESLLARTRHNLGYRHSETGDPARALGLYREAREIQLRLVARGPASPKFRSDLATSCNNIGHLLDQTGRPDAARESHREALAIRRGLVEDDPGSAPYLSELAISLDNLAAIDDASGQVDRALEAYREALGINRRLAREHPAYNERQDALARSLRNVGHLLGRRGERGRAVESHREALAIRERLARDNPGVADYRSSLATDHHELGGLLGAMDDRSGALESCRKALAIREGLARDHPAVAEFRAELASSLNSLGTLLGDMGQSDGALEALSRALAIREGLAREAPEFPGHRSSLAASQNNLGYQLARSGDRGRAMEAYRRAVATREALGRSHPDDLANRSSLAFTLANVGDLRRRSGDPASALEPYRRALAARESLASVAPTDVEARAQLAVIQQRIGYALAEAGRPAEALEWFARALEIREGLDRDVPTDPARREELWSTLLDLGQTSARLGRAADAVAAFRRAVALEARISRDPDTLYALACAQSLLAGAAALPGSGLTAEGARDEGRRAAEKLDRAIAAGYRDLGVIRVDRDLDPIRTRDDFRAILMDLAFPARPFAGP